MDNYCVIIVSFMLQAGFNRLHGPSTSYIIDWLIYGHIGSVCSVGDLHHGLSHWDDLSTGADPRWVQHNGDFHTA